MEAKYKLFISALIIAFLSILVPQAHCEIQHLTTHPTFAQASSGQILPPVGQGWPSSSSSSRSKNRPQDTSSFSTSLSPFFAQLPQSPPASSQPPPPPYEDILYPSCVQEYAQVRASCAGDIRMSVVVRRIVVGAGCCRAIQQVNRDCSTPFFEQVSQQYCASPASRA